MTIEVTDGNEGLESGSLTGTGLLLDGHDLQNLVLKLGAKERVDNLGLLQDNAKGQSLLQVHAKKYEKLHNLSVTHVGNKQLLYSEDRRV